MQLPRNISTKVIKDTLLLLRPGTIEDLAKRTIINSTFLRWRFAYVAKKFGIIEKDADHRFIKFNVLFDLHKGTPAYREAVNKVLWEDLDIANTEKVVTMIANGEIEIVEQPLSPIGLWGVTRTKELMQPLRADHMILMALKKRLENETMFPSCLFGQNQWRVRVEFAPKRFVCCKCGGIMIAMLKEYDRDNIKLFAKDPETLTAQEKKDVARLRRIANLVNEGGKRAAMTLAGRGVGPESASRILGRSHADEDEFLRDILSAEVLFAKNKRFWD
jgi:ATP-dependent Lhr-like helicase